MASKSSSALLLVYLETVRTLKKEKRKKEIWQGVKYFLHSAPLTSSDHNMNGFRLPHGMESPPTDLIGLNVH